MIEWTYMYTLYTYHYTDEYEDGTIYSQRELSQEELMHLIERAIKIIGSEKADSPSRVCEKATELIGGKESNINIKEIKTFRYYFADECNSGADWSYRRRDEEPYDWLGEVIRPTHLSRLFFCRAKYYFDVQNPTPMYEPSKFGLDEY